MAVLDEDPFAGLTIPETCVKIFGVNETLPDSEECFDVMYSRYPPYTIELAGVGWKKHPRWIYMCGAVVAVIRSAISRIGITCLQMKLQGSFTASYPLMNQVHFPVGIVIRTPPPAEAHKSTLHWQLGRAFTSVILARENFDYNAHIELHKIFETSTWTLIGLSLIVLTVMELIFERSSSSEGRKNFDKTTLIEFVDGLIETFGIFMSDVKLSVALHGLSDRLRTSQQWLRTVWALAGLFLLNLACDSFLELLLRPPTSNRFKEFEDLVQGCPAGMTVHIIVGYRLAQLIEAGQALIKNYVIYASELEIYAKLHEMYSAISAGTALFIGNLDTCRGVMRGRLMREYNTKHVYVTVDENDERPYFLPTSRQNLTPNQTAHFSFAIRQWIQSGLYNMLHERAAQRVYPVMRDPEQEEYEAGHVTTSPIPLASFWSIVSLLSYTCLLVPCLTFFVEWLMIKYNLLTGLNQTRHPAGKTTKQ